MYGFWNLLAGYVIVEARGLGMERLLNRATAAGIRMEQVERRSYTVLRMRVSLPGYLRLKKLAEGLCPLQVLRAGGMTRAFLFIRKRWWLAAGCAAVILAMGILSSFCWNIRIEGLETINEYDVYQTILENGGGEFTPKSTIDLEKISLALRMKYPKLSYAHASFDGVELVVRVAEGSLPPQIRSTEPATVYAKKAGVIEKITVLEGQAAVEVGDRVSEGDILIHGSFYMNEVPFLVTARGMVTARVDYLATSRVTYEDETLRPTGRTATERWMRLGGRLTKIDGENPFSVYIKEERVAENLGENMPAHAEIIEITYYEAEKTASEENKEKAIIEAKENAYNLALREIPENLPVEGFRFHVLEEDGTVTVTATLTVLEEIGQTGEIAIQQAPEPEAGAQE